MRRYVVPTIVLSAIGFGVGELYRHLIDPPEQETLANYIRSGVHGTGLALAGWGAHLYFTSRWSTWLTRWPLAAELGIRSLVTAVVVAAASTALQLALYPLPIESDAAADWFANDFPIMMVVAFVMSVVLSSA